MSQQNDGRKKNIQNNNNYKNKQMITNDNDRTKQHTKVNEWFDNI